MTYDQTRYMCQQAWGDLPNLDELAWRVHLIAASSRVADDQRHGPSLAHAHPWTYRYFKRPTLLPVVWAKKAKI